MNKITPEVLGKWITEKEENGDIIFVWLEDYKKLASEFYAKFITPLQEEIEKWKQERDEYTTCIHFDDGVGMGECGCRVASLIAEPLREKAEHYDSLQRQYEGVCASLVEAGKQLASKAKKVLSPETKPESEMVECPYGISSDCGCLSFCEDCKDGKIPKEKL